MASRPRNVLWIGDETRREWQAALAFCRARARLTIAKSGTKAQVDAIGIASFDLVVLAPDFPGAISHAEAHQLLERWPLAARCVLVGSWSEGEGRSGHPLPGWPRVRVDQWAGWWWVWERSEQTSERHHAQPWQQINPLVWRPPTWQITDEGWDAAAAPLLEPEPCETAIRPWVIVGSEWPSEQEVLLDACHLLGYGGIGVNPDSFPDIRGPAMVVLDGWPQPERREAIVRAWRHHYPSSPILLVMSFPRADERESAESWGVFRVLGKPYGLTDLAAALAEADRALRLLVRHGL